MSKAVLRSIKSYYVFLIIAKEMGWNIPQNKEIEVGKTIPKDKDWNKRVLIYCSKDKKSFNRIPKEYQPFMKQLLGKVIGEFICDNIIHIQALTDNFGDKHLYNTVFMNNTCLKDGELFNYLTRGSEEKNKMFRGYGYHITKLKIYNKPKELSEFYKACNNNANCFYCKKAKFSGGNCVGKLTRPPQSWCYCEDLGEKV